MYLAKRHRDQALLFSDSYEGLREYATLVVYVIADVSRPFISAKP